MAHSETENKKQSRYTLNMGKPLRTFVFIATRVILVFLFILAIIIGFKTGADSMNVYTMLKDGFSLRAQVVLQPNDSDAEKLSNYFTQKELLNDEILSRGDYDDYTVTKYYERLNAGMPIVWPWQDKVTFNVIEQVMDLKGSYSGAYLSANGLTEEDVSEIDVEIPKWQDGEYKVTLLRPENDDESWKIDSIEYVGPAEDKMMKVYEEEEVEIPDNVVIAPEDGTKTGGGTIIQDEDTGDGD